MSIIHTQPTKSVDVRDQRMFMVQSGATQIAGSVALSEVISVRWTIALKDLITNETCVYEVFAMYNESNNSVSHNVYNILGTLIINNTDVSIMGGSHMVIQITNNNQNSIEIRIRKQQTLDI